MAIGDGRFVLHPRITPPLTAGDYRFTAAQSLITATGQPRANTAADLPVAAVTSNVRVRSARYQLPPDQVLSTFPPANSVGGYSMRLPQIVIKRRTLPWERTVVANHPEIPWMALVLIAEGEAELKLNAPMAECISADRPLAGVADSESGNYLSIAKSRIDQIFPTRLDVPLLAHAREVDINDTELMLGDDDGFLAVVISNRLPLPAKDADGRTLPVKYLACLINLEGQFDRLRDHAPDPTVRTFFPTFGATLFLSGAELDRARMNLPANAISAAGHLGAAIGPADPGDPADLGVLGDEPAPRYRIAATQAELAGANTVSDALSGTNTAAGWGAVRGLSSADIYAGMAHGFELATQVTGDPVYRFPVLLHWSFTSDGTKSFQELMEQLDSGMLGTVPAEKDPPDPPLSGRPPLELVETGHVGVPQRTRVGDEVRCWYRGPLVAHPNTDPNTVPETVPERLPLAHGADQLRIVVPDGREDLSLASAFEIGRLLALARPSITAGLLRWRQTAFQTSRQRATWEVLDEVHFGGRLTELLAALDPPRLLTDVGPLLQQTLIGAILTAPEDVIGRPNPLVRPGRPIDGITNTTRLIATGFGLPADALGGTLRDVSVALPRVPVATGAAKSDVIARHLEEHLDVTLARLVTDTLGQQVRIGGPHGERIGAAPPGTRRRRDALDRLIAELNDRPRSADDGSPDDDNDGAPDGSPDDATPSTPPTPSTRGARR